MKLSTAVLLLGGVLCAAPVASAQASNGLCATPGAFDPDRALQATCGPPGTEAACLDLAARAGGLADCAGVHIEYEDDGCQMSRVAFETQDLAACCAASGLGAYDPRQTCGLFVPLAVATLTSDPASCALTGDSIFHQGGAVSNAEVARSFAGFNGCCTDGLSCCDSADPAACLPAATGGDGDDCPFETGSPESPCLQPSCQAGDDEACFHAIVAYCTGTGGADPGCGVLTAECPYKRLVPENPCFGAACREDDEAGCSALQAAYCGGGAGSGDPACPTDCAAAAVGAVGASSYDADCGSPPWAKSPADACSTSCAAAVAEIGASAGCCITDFITSVAGDAGLAAANSWIELSCKLPALPAACDAGDGAGAGACVDFDGGAAGQTERIHSEGHNVTLCFSCNA